MFLNKMKETGNENLMLTERGFSFGYNNLVVDMRSSQLCVLSTIQ